MRAFLPLLLLFSVAAQAAVVSPLTALSPGSLCRAAIAGAEQAQAIPVRLMVAIGRVESGRRDAATGAHNPWPWTVNAEGQGFFYDSKAQAVAAVQAMQARGVKSIDVGCMQENLMHHPDAFPNLDRAFDPPANAAYAAKFLRQLFVQSGDWTKAVALYHSATPALSEPYAKKVMALWPEETQRPIGPTALASAWGATVPHATLAPAQRNVGPPAAGSLSVGKGLDLYRSQPVGAVSRPRRASGRF